MAYKTLKNAKFDLTGVCNILARADVPQMGSDSDYRAVELSHWEWYAIGAVNIVHAVIHCRRHRVAYFILFRVSIWGVNLA